MTNEEKKAMEINTALKKSGKGGEGSATDGTPLEKRADAQGDGGSGDNGKLDQIMQCLGDIARQVKAQNDMINKHTEFLNAAQKDGGGSGKSDYSDDTQDLSLGARTVASPRDDLLDLSLSPSLVSNTNTNTNDASDPERKMAPRLAADSWAATEAKRVEDVNTRAQFQCRADAIAQEWGERAPPPMSSEGVHDYRMRLLKRFQPHSPDYREIDLRKISDPKLFSIAESKIYADALEASKCPEVGENTLRRITKTGVAGHTIVEYHGRPSAWMDQFAGPVRQYVKQFYDGVPK